MAGASCDCCPILPNQEMWVIGHIGVEIAFDAIHRNFAHHPASQTHGAYCGCVANDTFSSASRFHQGGFHAVTIWFLPVTDQ
jgi:hypothetical protein